MRYLTKTNDIMISSYELSPDELLRCAVGVTTALHLLHPTQFLPRVFINEFDEDFGNSVNIEFKYHTPRKEGCN